MGRKNDPTPEGVNILNDESNIDDYLLGPVAESEGDDYVTIGDDHDTLTSPAPTVPSEWALSWIVPAKEYTPAR